MTNCPDTSLPKRTTIHPCPLTLLDLRLSEVKEMLSPWLSDMHRIRQSGLVNVQRAVEICTQAIESDPYDANAYHFRAYYRIYYSLKDALQDLDESIRLNATCPEAYFNRGILRFLNQDSIGAASDFTQVLTFNPLDGLAYFGLGAAQCLNGELQTALASYTAMLNIIASYPDELGLGANYRSWARVSRGQLLAMHNEYRKALVELETIAFEEEKFQASQSFKTHLFPMIYIDIGYCYASLGDHHKAMKNFQTAIANLSYFTPKLYLTQQGDLLNADPPGSAQHFEEVYLWQYFNQKWQDNLLDLQKASQFFHNTAFEVDYCQELKTLSDYE